MQTKLQYVIDFGNYEERKVAGRDEFLGKFGSVLQHYVSEANAAFFDMQKRVSSIPPIEIEPRLRAVMMNGMLCGRMMRAYPDVCQRRKYKRASFQMEGMITFIKKLDERLLPGHALSKNSQALLRQLTTKEERGGAVMWMGYTVDRMWKRITGLHVVYINNKEIKWHIDILEHLGGKVGAELLPKTPISPIAPVEPGLKRLTGKQQKENE